MVKQMDEVRLKVLAQAGFCVNTTTTSLPSSCYGSSSLLLGIARRANDGKEAGRFLLVIELPSCNADYASDAHR